MVTEGLLTTFRSPSVTLRDQRLADKRSAAG
jgi:hypothetical protein